MMKRWIATFLTLTCLALTPAAQAGESTKHAKPAKSGKAQHAQKKAKKHSAKKPSSQKTRSAKRKAAHARHLAKAQRAGKHSRSARAPRPDPYDAALSTGQLNLYSHAALVIDQQTGQPLYAKNPDLATPIASITKLMTAMVSLDAGLDLDEEIEIDLQDVDYLKHTRSRLPVGTRLTRGELMHLALIASENRAAAALSRAYPGGREDFIAAMNRKAGQLGMERTWFVDGTGLSSENRSTAVDLAKMVDAAYRYPVIRDITTTGQYAVTLPARTQYRNIAFTNTNALTRNSTWDIGLSKTGYINEAGHCLVMQANIASQKVIIVLLDSWGKLSRIGDAGRIRRWLESGGAGKLAAREAPEAV